MLHLDLNTEKYDAVEVLENKLSLNLKYWEEKYGGNEHAYSLATRFEGVIRRACEKTGRRVVILIDEYDKPMLQAIGNDSLLDEYRSTLKAFYGALKSMDSCIRFALLTGVTKFSMVSVFSDLNNLEDITLQSAYNSLCGITEGELLSVFTEDIRALAANNDMSYVEACTQLREWYDGYHFAYHSEGLYNPFSLLNVMKSRVFDSYWFETGTPTFLVEQLKRSRLTEEMASSDSLGGIDTMDANPVPILYQSGYLTIKDYDREFKVYKLGFPNKEVEEGFTRFLLPCYAHLASGNSSFEIMNFVKEVRGGNIDGFMRRLQSFFADSPYELARDLELHYQNVLFIIFKLLGFYTQAEYHTSQGRIGLLVKTDRYIYVMEFKLDGTAEEALLQIDDRQYAMPSAADGRTVYKVGVNFSNRLRGIERWVVE